MAVDLFIGDLRRGRNGGQEGRTMGALGAWEQPFAAGSSGGDPAAPSWDGRGLTSTRSAARHLAPVDAATVASRDQLAASSVQTVLRLPDRWPMAWPDTEARFWAGSVVAGVREQASLAADLALDVVRLAGPVSLAEATVMTAHIALTLAVGTHQEWWTELDPQRLRIAYDVLETALPPEVAAGLPLRFVPPTRRRWRGR